MIAKVIRGNWDSSNDLKDHGVHFVVSYSKYLGQTTYRQTCFMRGSAPRVNIELSVRFGGSLR